jgi:zinc transport system substrate-binding protein
MLPSAYAVEKLKVYTVNYPLQYFAERIGGEHVDVKFPAPADVDPAFWMPDTETIGAYQQADLILLNGAGYAKWVKKVALPRRKLVNTSSSFRDEYISIKNVVTHQHGPAGDHSHAGTAFTTWLDFKQAAQQAGQIAAAMKRARPEQAQVFADNYRQLEQELMLLDARLLDITNQRPLIASHPVYQYLARRYKLNLRSLMWEPDIFPDPLAWQELNSISREHAAAWMLWEDEPLQKTREHLSESGIKVIVFRPVMNRPEKGDFMTMMEANIKTLAEAFR